MTAVDLFSIVFMSAGDLEGSVEHLGNAVMLCRNQSQFLQTLQQNLPAPVFQLLILRLPSAAAVSLQIGQRMFKKIIFIDFVMSVLIIYRFLNSLLNSNQRLIHWLYYYICCYGSCYIRFSRLLQGLVHLFQYNSVPFCSTAVFALLTFLKLDEQHCFCVCHQVLCVWQWCHGSDFITCVWSSRKISGN